MRWLSVLAAVADLSVGLILMIFQVHWDVFKSLCGIGHTFDAHYGVEIGTPDEIYEDFCVYSNLEQMTLAASCVQLILDILVLLALLQILPELPLQAEARREAIKKLSAGFGAFSGAAFDSRSGSTKNPQLRDLESPETTWDDFGVGISLGSGRKRNSRRSTGSTASPDEDDLDGLLSARRDSPRRQRKRSQRNSRRETKAPHVLSVEDIDSEDIELGQLFAPVKVTNGNSSRRRASVRGVPGVPGSARSSSPRKTESPRKIGRPEVDWQTPKRHL